MKSMKITMNLPVFVIVLLLAVVAGYEVFAGRAAAPGPAVVAVVRIGPLFDGLKQKADAEVTSIGFGARSRRKCRHARRRSRR